MVTVGRVCNMLGEISKRRNQDESECIKFYLKGITAEPLGYFENYTDLADQCGAMGYLELSLIILKLS